MSRYGRSAYSGIMVQQCIILTAEVVGRQSVASKDKKSKGQNRMRRGVMRTKVVYVEYCKCSTGAFRTGSAANFFVCVEFIRS